MTVHDLLVALLPLDTDAEVEVAGAELPDTAVRSVQAHPGHKTVTLVVDTYDLHADCGPCRCREP